MRKVVFRNTPGCHAKMNIHRTFAVSGSGEGLLKYFLRIGASSDETITGCAFQCLDYKNGEFTYMPNDEKERMSIVREILKNANTWKGRYFCSIEFPFDFFDCDPDLSYDVKSNFLDIVNLVKTTAAENNMEVYIAVFHAQQITENGFRPPHFHIYLRPTVRARDMNEYYQWVDNFIRGIGYKWQGATDISAYYIDTQQ